MSCLCAPTRHAGSFRCRLHRSQQSWAGRPMPCGSANSDELDMRSSLSGVQAAIGSCDAGTVTSSLPQSAPRDQNKLRRMDSGAIDLDVKTILNEEIMYVARMITGAEGRYSTAPVARSAVCRSLETGNSAVKIF